MKYVYLFELDSVRNSDEEIVQAQKALFNEIAVNGNVVVMTYNQLVDSRGMFSLLRHDEYRENLLKLFETGAIKISQFDDQRTASQYLQGSVEENREFIYSALPLKFSQKRLAALMRRSLAYSDLSEIHHYTQAGEDQLRELFVEVDPGGTLCQTRLDFAQMQRIVLNLYWLLEIVLKISMLHDAYIPPRKTDEYSDLRLRSIMERVLEFHLDEGAYPLWRPAADLLRSLLNQENSLDRSVYLRRLQQSAETADPASDIQAFQYTEAIINLCYNYACEISVCNTSKRYNVNELKPEGEGRTQGDSFQQDFLARLQEYWSDGQGAPDKFLRRESNAFHFFDDTKAKKISADIAKVAKIHTITQRAPKAPSADGAAQMAGLEGEGGVAAGVPRYQFKYVEQVRQHRKRAIRCVAQLIFAALVGIAIACLIEVGIQEAQVLLDSSYNLDSVAWFVFETLLFLSITELVTTALSKIVPNQWVLSLSDALGDFATNCRDLHRILKGIKPRPVAACGSCEEHEAASTPVNIEFVKTPALKKYLRFIRNRENAHYLQDSDREGFQFALKAVGPNGEQLKEVLKDEELRGRKYGVVYQSAYNTVVVDPLRKSPAQGAGGQLYPYERVVPTANKPGVVILPRHKGDFILLKQYRHALRDFQLGFPRGYAEADGTLSAEDARRELKEELKIDCGTAQPQYLGEIAADSGLMSSKAQVYLIDISDSDFDAAKVERGYEGIEDVVRIPCDRLRETLKKLKVDDGFTLSAAMLYQATC